MKKIDPIQIQEDYNSGMSYRQIQKKYGISSKTLTMLHRQGLLKTRTKSEAAKLEHQQKPHKHTEEFKESQRNRILQRYADGWMPKAGRCAKIKYNSLVAGTVLLDGTWELKAAEYLDSIGVMWVRNKQRFPYVNLVGKQSHYTPDFWVETWDTFIEVKGYETDLDKCKWSQFPFKLLVWKRDTILGLS